MLDKGLTARLDGDCIMKCFTGAEGFVVGLVLDILTVQVSK